MFEGSFNLLEIKEFFLGIFTLFLTKFKILADGTDIQGQAISASFIIALFTGAVAYFFKKRNEFRLFRVKNSHEKIKNKDEALDNAFNATSADIYKLKDDKCFKISFNEINQKRAEYTILLKDYEVTGVEITAGFISEKYMRRIYKTNIQYTFISLSPLIRKIRRASSNKFAYCYFEALFLRVHFGTYRHILIPLEFIIGRPLLKTTQIIFKIEYFVFGNLLRFFHQNQSFYRRMPPDYLRCDWYFE